MGVGYPDWTTLVISSASNMEQLKVSVTDTEKTASFSVEVKSVLIYNDGGSDVHFNNQAGVTASNFKIPANSWIGIDLKAKTLYFKCDSGGSATVYLIGLY